MIKKMSKTRFPSCNDRSAVEGAVSVLTQVNKRAAPMLPTRLYNTVIHRLISMLPTCLSYLLLTITTDTNFTQLKGCVNSNILLKTVL